MIVVFSYAMESPLGDVKNINPKNITYKPTFDFTGNTDGE